jgi:signal transduction histidine kinase
LTERAKVRLDLELDEHADACLEVRANVLGIVSEAISNAVRHGDAQSIRVRLANGRGLQLSIADDGTGFDPRREADGVSDRGGFGLVGMRERAERLGGSLLVQSRPGGGTEVQVLVREQRHPGSRKHSRSPACGERANGRAKMTPGAPEPELARAEPLATQAPRSGQFRIGADDSSEWS